MRKVQVSKYNPSVPSKKTIIGIGLFHQFGVDYEELVAGTGNCTTAIVEMLDGSVKSVPVANIKFLDKPK